MFVDEKEVHRRLAEARYTQGYMGGVVDTFDWVLAQGTGQPEAPASADQPSASTKVASYRPQKVSTQRVILDILRDATTPLTCGELIALARARGHDILRDTVNTVLRRNTDRKLLEKKGWQYQVVRARLSDLDAALDEDEEGGA